MQNIASPLSEKKIGIVVESKFIPEEISAYQTGFILLGAQVEFISRLYYGNYRPDQATFISDVDPLDEDPWMTPQKLYVRKDVSTVNLDEYAALLMSANYTSVRLRYGGLPDNLPANFNLRGHLQNAPVVSLFSQAMQRKKLVKGFLCHGLWILTPNPQWLSGRHVVCNEVVAADILNCGANVDLSNKVITDADVVTAYSKHEVVAFIGAVANAILNSQ
jgi:protease I